MKKLLMLACAGLLLSSSADVNAMESVGPVEDWEMLAKTPSPELLEKSKTSLSARAITSKVCEGFAQGQARYNVIFVASV